MGTREREVARENRAASMTDLAPTDPRWVLAVRTHEQLDGSTLTPERRARVLRTARTLGVRAFDANLIIAIVQDHARRGAPLPEAAPVLELVADARDAPPPWFTAFRWMSALGAALVGTAILIRWLLS